MNGVSDDIDINNSNLYFHPDDVYNYVYKSPEIKNEEKDLFTNRYKKNIEILFGS
jgi:hypothetical protein